MDENVAPKEISVMKTSVVNRPDPGAEMGREPSPLRVRPGGERGRPEDFFERTCPRNVFSQNERSLEEAHCSILAGRDGPHERTVDLAEARKAPELPCCPTHTEEGVAEETLEPVGQ